MQVRMLQVRNEMVENTTEVHMPFLLSSNRNWRRTEKGFWLKLRGKVWLMWARSDLQ